MKAKTAVSNAVESAGFTDGYMVELGLSYALTIIKAILSDLPWYKKVILTVKFLIQGIEGYLKDKGWDV